MAEKYFPSRRCIGCMKVYPKPTLVRLVKYESLAVIDEGATLPGRGVYLCQNASCADKALKGGRINHFLNVNVTDENKEEILKYFTKYSK